MDAIFRISYHMFGREKGPWWVRLGIKVAKLYVLPFGNGSRNERGPLKRMCIGFSNDADHSNSKVVFGFGPITKVCRPTLLLMII